MKTASRLFASFETTFSQLLLVLLSVLLSIQIVNRYLFSTSFVWLEEIARVSFVWLVYFAVAGAARENRHIEIGVVDLFVPPSGLKVIKLLADILVIVFDLVIVWLGILLIWSTIQYGDRSPVTEIPMGFIYAVIPFCFALMAFRVLYAKVKGRKSERLKQFEDA